MGLQIHLPRYPLPTPSGDSYRGEMFVVAVKKILNTTMSKRIILKVKLALILKILLGS